MFAPKVGRAQTKAAASSANELGPPHRMLRPSIGNQAMLRLLAQRTQSTASAPQPLRQSPDPTPALHRQALASPGRSIEAPIAAQLSAALDHDFAAVRVHADHPPRGLPRH